MPGIRTIHAIGVPAHLNEETPHQMVGGLLVLQAR
jgi:hypothetical protein